MIYKFQISGFVKEVVFVIITLTIYILVGISRSYMAFLFYQLDFPDSKIFIDVDQKSSIASSLGILSPIGCIFSGTIMDCFGRKIFLLIMFVPFIISWSIMALASNFDMLFWAMVLQGLGGGMCFCVSTYISEISTPKNRGALLSIIEVAYNVGVVLCNILMYNIRWDTVAIIYIVMSLIFMLFMCLLPESPVWLYNKGEKDKAVRILRSLRCAEMEQIQDEILDMERCSSEEQEMKHQSIASKVKNVLRAWKPFTYVTILFALMTHTGYAVMVVYAIMVFDRLNLPFDSSKITLAYSVVGFIGSSATPFFMHQLGRKTILSMSALGMALPMVAVSLYEQIFSDYDRADKPLAWMVPIAFYVYVLSCNIGVLPIGLMIGGEMFPNEVRGVMNGLYGIFAYTYYAVNLKLYPKFISWVGINVVIWTFTCSCFLVSLFGCVILPETRGKTLNEIQEQYFQKKKKDTKANASEVKQQSSV